MKEVMAIIRINMINQTKRALAEAGISLPLQRKIGVFRIIEKKTITKKHIVIIILVILILYIITAITNSLFMVKIKNN